MANKKNTQVYWNSVYQSEADWRIYPHTNAWIASHVTPKSSVYDIGCGTAHSLRYLFNHNISFYQYVGIDISNTVISYNQKKYAQIEDALFICRDVLDVGERSEVFNFISIQNANKYKIFVMSEFVEHFTDDELTQLFAYMRRSVVFEKLLITVPHNTLPPEDCKEHEQCFNEWTLRELLETWFDRVTISYGNEQFNTPQGHTITLPVLHAVCRMDEKQ